MDTVSPTFVVAGGLLLVFSGSSGSVELRLVADKHEDDDDWSVLSSTDGGCGVFTDKPKSSCCAAVGRRRP